MKAKNLAKRILEEILIGTLLIGNVKDICAPVKDNSKIFMECNKPKYRKISDNKKSSRAKKLHPHILSYAGETDTLYLPEYSYLGKNGVPSTNCPRYARFTAKDLFNLDYSKEEGAWDLRYGTKIIKSSNVFGIDSLNKFVDEKILQPGMIIGFYNPKSPYNNGRDKMRNKRRYTHVGVYLGQDEYNEITLAHQWGSKTRVDNIFWFYRKGLIPKEILDVKNQD